MRAGEILAGLFWLALAAGAASVGWALGLGTLRAPGPGFLLFGVGLIMVGLSAVVVAAAARAPAPAPGTPGPWAATRFWRICARRRR
jgi:Mn2+/Fe2+ NRAMP family transporter